MFFFKKNKIYYIVENADWSIKWDGLYITKWIRDIYNIDADVYTDFRKIKRSIVHFGSRNLFLPHAWEKVHPSNNIIFTWFHGTDKDLNPENQLMIKNLPDASSKAALVHTSCTISRDRLVKWGVSQDKIVLIPLGVDTGLFKPAGNEDEKIRLRKSLGVPEGSLCIGSFQKDGNGWGNGDEPKLIKGPDVFCDVVAELSRKYPIHVLLTGPARGYVKSRLSKSNIPFTHSYLEDYLNIVKYYKAIDLYLVTSREEGGPKSVLESMACGVPIVSTDVGMSHDMVVNGVNGFLAEVDNIGQIAEYATRLIEDKELRDRCVDGGLETIKNYDWNIIARRYYEEIYSRFLKK